MLPDLTVLLALILGLIHLKPGSVDSMRAVVGTVATTCVAVALTWMSGDRGLKAIRASRLPAAFSSARWTSVWPLLGWIACLQFSEWGVWVETEVSRMWWIGRYVLLFAPAAAMFAAGWVTQGRIEGALSAARGAIVPPATARESIRRGFRRNGIALIPIGLLLAFLDGVWILGAWGVPGMRTASRWIEAMPLLSTGVMLVLVCAIALMLPAIFRRVLSTERLPDGRMRSLLERSAAAQRLRYRDLVVWNTKGRVLNAMVVGFTPRTRTIFLTDALLRHLPEEEILAVFSHEAGHAKKHHLPLFLVLFITTALLWQVAAELLVPHGVPAELMLVLHLAFVWFVILGSISRVFEREADLYGSVHAAELEPDAESLAVPGLKAPLPAGAARMIRALQRIRAASGREASHRHGTIDGRVQYVAEWSTDPQVRTAFRKTKRGILLATLVATLAAATVVALRLPTDVPIARAHLAFSDALESADQGLALLETKPAEAAPRWQSAYDGFDRTIGLLRGLDDVRARELRLISGFNRADTALHGLGDEARAAKDFETMLQVADAGGLPSEATRYFRFQAHVDLGRIRAHEGNLESARRHHEQVLSLRPDASGESDSYNRARQSLLEAALMAADGEVDQAREKLERDVRGVSRSDVPRWQELRRDAQTEMDRLAPP